MGNRIGQKPQGFAIVDPRWSAENLRPQTSIVGDSVYTEQNPRPGQMVVSNPNSEALIEVRAVQENDVTFKVQRGGSATRNRARHIYRLDSETAPFDFRGWNPPNFPVHFEQIAGGTGNTIAGINVTVIPSTQEPVVFRGNNVYTWDNATQTFSGTVLFDEDGVALQLTTTTGGCVVIPGSERIVAVTIGTVSDHQVNVFFSDDKGVSFQLAFSGNLGGGPTDFFSGETISDSCGVAYNDGEILLSLRKEGSGQRSQWASGDFGANFTFIAETLGFVRTVGQCVADPAGGFLQSVENFGTGSLLATGSAFEPLSTLNIPDPSPFTDTAAAALAQEVTHATWIDPDGTWWSIMGHVTGISMVFSEDRGATWIELVHGLANWNSTQDYIENIKVAPTKSGAIIVHTGHSDTFEVGNSPFTNAWFLGGWSKIETQAHSVLTQADKEQVARRLGFGLDNGAIPVVDFTTTWLPFDLPDDMGLVWAQSGAVAGVLVSGGYMRLTTAAQLGRYDTVGLPAQLGVNFIVAQFQVISGGSLTATEAGFRSRVADGAADYRVHVNADSTGFRVIDSHGAATLADVVVDMTAGVTIAVAHRFEDLQVFYHLPGFTSEWIEVVNGTANVTDGGALAPDGLIQFGHVTSGTAESRWQQFHVNAHNEFAASYFATDDTKVVSPSKRDRMYGRWLTPLAMPLPVIGSVDACAFVAGVRGPLSFGEESRIPTSHDFPIESIFPTISPNPGQPWRSVDDQSDVSIAIDYTRESRADGSWAYVLGLLGTNLHIVEIQGWDGAAWNTVGTYNGGTDFTGLDYVLNGDILEPSGLTAEGDRFVQNGEYAGGYVVLDPLGTPKVRKIVSHSAGTWNDGSATTLRPVFRIEVDGTEPATGACDLRARNAVHFMYLDGTAADLYSRFRLFIPAASNPTAEGWFEIGAAPFAAVTVVGQQWGRGWSRAMIPNVTTRTSRAGTIRRKQEGKPARRWVMSWQTGLNVRQLRVHLDNNYLSAMGGKPPLAADQDVWFQLYGLIESAKGGEIPLLALARFPDANDTTITDRTGFLYGLVQGTIQANNVTGQELAGEAMRVESITIEELIG